MSLEAQLEALGSKIDALTDITTKLYSLRADAIETVRNTAGGGKADTKKSDDKPAETKKTDDKPKTDAPGEMNDMQRAIAAYVGEEGVSEAERKARQQEVLKVLAHDKIKAKKASEVPEKFHGAVIKAVNTLKERGNVIQEEAVSEDDDDGGLLD